MGGKKTTRTWRAAILSPGYVAFARGFTKHHESNVPFHSEKYNNLLLLFARMLQELRSWTSGALVTA